MGILKNLYYIYIYKFNKNLYSCAHFCKRIIIFMLYFILQLTSWNPISSIPTCSIKFILIFFFLTCHYVCLACADTREGDCSTGTVRRQGPRRLKHRIRDPTPVSEQQMYLFEPYEWGTFSLRLKQRNNRTFDPLNSLHLLVSTRTYRKHLTVIINDCLFCLLTFIFIL